MEEIKIFDLIQRLEELLRRNCKTVQIGGTLMCAEDGNTIIISTEKQI